MSNSEHIYSIWSREIFGNIPATAQRYFYLCSAVALALFLWGIYRRTRVWRLPLAGSDDAAKRTNVGRTVMAWCRTICAPLVDRTFWQRLWHDGLLLRRFRHRPIPSLAHRLLFWGFGVLFIGTVLIAIEHVLAWMCGRPPSDPVFHRGIYYVFYEIVLEIAGLALLSGTFLFAARRARHAASIAYSRADWLALAALAAIGLTGYLTEALRIAAMPGAVDHFSFVGNMIAKFILPSPITAISAEQAHFIVWWTHALLALALIGLFPYLRLWHAIAAVAHLAHSRRDVGMLGRIPLVTLEELEQTGKIGIGEPSDLTQRQIIEIDACVSCGRCQDVCPAYEAGKPLSPRDVVQDMRHWIDGLLQESGGPQGSNNGSAADHVRRQLHGDVIGAETILACTTCSACSDACPIGISPLGMIVELRRHFIADGKLRGAPATSLQKLERTGNPWGLASQDRFQWADGLNVPTVEDNPTFEILYWVGCAAAYDRRVQKVARAMVQLLRVAGVNYAVLGPRERCTGESARRLGDEFVFQGLAGQNRETLDHHRVRRIVTHCPHCLNSFRHDYPQLGPRYDVIHHTQLLAELIDQGRLPQPEAALADPIAYHDPCYLARVHGITDPPRRLLRHAGAAVVEMARQGRDTACCGAGGGRMWFDDPPETRIGKSRVAEVMATGAETLAVACPFCSIMLHDGITAAGGKVEVRDIAEILAERLPA